MTKNMIKALRILVFAVLLVGMPVGVFAEVDGDDIETEMVSVTLRVNGTRVTVSGANGKTLEVYNLTGVKIATFRIDSDEKQLNLSTLSRGYYILKVDGVVRKICLTKNA